MFDDLRDLYQEVILDHGRKPRNFRRLEDADRHARGDNPLCGDRMELWVKLDGDGHIADAAFQGKGCAISMASASLMTETVRGKSAAEAKELGTKFRELAMTGTCPDCGADLAEEMERLQVLGGVAEYPSRVKCATLAWHTLNAALEGAKEASSE
ncbi:IscU protein [Roseomonas mucosa]|uniref:NifU-like protein n=1 Tax=Roseomonas mucosa TaxID=207340 RepID=A0A1S8CZM5_9PROT|nr:MULTISPECIES: SUF system NifU family Fe-S cluster assembly protein [Roseomonas]MBS5905203.1 SUF system NifU family Fe-S cluster assembly protein [Acetobacteraceae bacterium]MDT8261878.1 SUF system NifU family Fe-S cluster assembly protein [Roseomonas sp. DSM 102946]ATR20731.1 SUF system NifU family Fe-S cluster assembly protein [Roseomonas sp. FDAARGOS_362]AWV22747.1 IscU protein [Roseomonas mucosa]MCG7354092.1 SUF system NifU family Fe-S cluster assembly protein [Roseomonas mucosa]